MTPESFVQAVKSYSSGQLSAQLSKDFLDSLPRTCEALGKVPWVALDTLCTQFSAVPEDYSTIGLFGSLFAKTKHQDFPNNLEQFLPQFASAVEGDNTDPAGLRACSTLLSGICESICDQVIRRKQPLLAINLMRSVITRVQTSPRQLTGVHASLLQLCLAAHAFKPALPYLKQEVGDFSIDLRGGECKSLLLYYYYGGMIFTGLKCYSEALYFFEACTRVPAQALSHIMLEAYKKYVLIALLHLGQLPPTHKSAMQVVNRILRPSAVPYTDLVTAFLTHNPTELGNVVNRHQEVFRRDSNYGLIKQVIVAQRKLNIQRLTKTFLTLSLNDVASRAGLPSALEAERILLSMIQDGEIYAKINQLDGMVVFLDDKEKYDNPKVLAKVEAQIARCVDLNKRLSEMNESLSTNPEFISKVVLSSSGGGGGLGQSLGLGDDQDLISSGGIIASSSSSSTSKIPSTSFSH